MNTRDKQIARVLFWDSLILLLLSGYEFAARLDSMLGPLKMFVNMAIGESIPLARVMTYVDLNVFAAPLFLLLCAVVGLSALIARRSRTWSAVLLLPCAALLVWGFTLRLTLFGSTIQLFKLLPLMILLLLNLARTVIRPKKPAPSPAPQVIVVRQRRSERLHRRRAS